MNYADHEFCRPCLPLAGGVTLPLIVFLSIGHQIPVSFFRAGLLPSVLFFFEFRGPKISFRGLSDVLMSLSPSFFPSVFGGQVLPLRCFLLLCPDAARASVPLIPNSLSRDVPVAMRKRVTGSPFFPLLATILSPSS